MPVEAMEDLFGPVFDRRLPVNQETLVREDEKPLALAMGRCHLPTLARETHLPRRGFARMTPEAVPGERLRARRAAPFTEEVFSSLERSILKLRRLTRTPEAQ
jgi:hypothetical protein